MTDDHNRACPVCSHDQAEEIDRALILGGKSLKAIAKAFGCDAKQLSLHRDGCLLPMISNAWRADRIDVGTDLWKLIERYMSRIEDVTARAERQCSVEIAALLEGIPKQHHAKVHQAVEVMAASDGRVLEACRAARPYLELIARLQGQISEVANVTVYSSPEMSELRDGLLHCLAKHPEAMQDVADFFAKTAREWQERQAIH